MKLIDITGKKFGRLTVLEKLPPRESSRGGSDWFCVCECGTTCVRLGALLRKAGATPSCGCYQAEWGKHLGSNREFVAKRAKAVATHGAAAHGTRTPEYQTWLRMKSRCDRKTDKNFPGWGGRGIRVCDRWQHDFAVFLADMGPRPSPNHTIDRLDSNKDYAPDNCRWAPQELQGAENRRGLVAVTVRGISFQTIAKACRHFGVGSTTVNERLRAGIPIDEAFTPDRLPARRTRESYIRKDLR